MASTASLHICLKGHLPCILLRQEVHEIIEEVFCSRSQGRVTSGVLEGKCPCWMLRSNFLVGCLYSMMVEAEMQAVMV